MTSKKAILWTVFWISLAALFNFGIFLIKGSQSAIEFFGAYIIEQSLSLDNLFLFIVIFDSFGVRAKYQRRVLNYGISGTILLRLIFIILGVNMIESFHWVLYLFGILLIISGAKILFSSTQGNMDYKKSWILGLLRKFISITKEFHGEKFFVIVNKKLMATPLLAVLVLIEVSDIIFAIDSIPAVFSMTIDPFIVYTSNIFAILGLRNMYFLIEKAHRAFRFAKNGIAIILIFTGIKLYIMKFEVEIPLMLSMAVVATILLVSILASVMTKKTSKFDNVKSIKANISK